MRSVWHPRHHTLSRFDPTERFGPNGQWLRENIERYDPATSFQAKGWGMHYDLLMSMPEQYPLLLFWGDLASCCVGTVKVMNAYARTLARIRQGDETIAS